MDLENEDHDVATVIGMIIGNVIISLIMGYWYQYLVNTYATHFKGEEIDLHFAIFFAFAFFNPRQGKTFNVPKCIGSICRIIFTLMHTTLCIIGLIFTCVLFIVSSDGDF